ncbi:hypothetical protein ABZZ92_03425 [Streptomyces ardesiacus]
MRAAVDDVEVRNGEQRRYFGGLGQVLPRLLTGRGGLGAGGGK